jgi:1,2-diacylglycerol 3-alpha-glucosyltransferase
LKYPPPRSTCGAFESHQKNWPITSAPSPSAAYFQRVSGDIGLSCPSPFMDWQPQPLSPFRGNLVELMPVTCEYAMGATIHRPFMRVLMATNTYLPHVSGVANAVDRMVRSLRQLGHEVIVVAPGDSLTAPIHADRQGVIRVPAIPSVAGSDLTLPLPTSERLTDVIAAFDPHIIHAHHQFSLGKAALNAARKLGKPIVVTVHTFHETQTGKFTLPIKLSLTAQIAKSAISFLGAATLPIFFENACDAVLAPTESAARLLRERGVTAPIYITPSGIDVDVYATPNGAAVRKKHAIDPGTFVVGHVGRLSKEKNLGFLAKAMAKFLQMNGDARAIIVGTGPCSGEMDTTFRAHRVASRVRWLGVQRGQALADAYGAMDVFAFASVIETQGLVLAEAMAAGAPVIALDGPGTRDIIRDGVNGQLVTKLDPESFAAALFEWSRLSPQAARAMKRNACETGASYALELTTRRLVAVYEQVASGVRHRLQSAR